MRLELFHIQRLLNIFQIQYDAQMVQNPNAPER